MESFFKKVAGRKTDYFNKNRLQQKCFPVNNAEFLRAAFLWNTSGGCFCIKDIIIMKNNFLREIFLV